MFAFYQLFFFIPSFVDLVKNKARRAGVSGIEVLGDSCSLVKNNSRKNAQLNAAGLDFETAGATDLFYMGNIYDTSDFP